MRNSNAISKFLCKDCAAEIINCTYLRIPRFPHLFLEDEIKRYYFAKVD
jgi:hypothetical protein